MPTFRRIWKLNLGSQIWQNFAKFNSLSSQTYLSAVLLRMQKERSLSTKHGRRYRESARMSSCSSYWRLKFLEGGNHDCDTFDYTLFRLDWVLNVLTRYLDTETTRADARLVHLVLMSSNFGRPRCPVKMLPDWNASVFREWLASVTASIASRTRWTKRASGLVVSVSKYLVSTFNTQSWTRYNQMYRSRGCHPLKTSQHLQDEHEGIRALPR